MLWTPNATSRHPLNSVSNFDLINVTSVRHTVADSSPGTHQTSGSMEELKKTATIILQTGLVNVAAIEKKKRKNNGNITSSSSSSIP